jgi:uncharacterized protein YjeT (DUF2065 family)
MRYRSTYPTPSWITCQGLRRSVLARVATHILQTILNGILDILLVQPGIFRRNVHILSRQPAFADRLARFGFVLVGLGGVYLRRSVGADLQR